MIKELYRLVYDHIIFDVQMKFQDVVVPVSMCSCRLSWPFLSTVLLATLVSCKYSRTVPNKINFWELFEMTSDNILAYDFFGRMNSGSITPMGCSCNLA
ncbi:ATP synthase subunit d, mitochondrial-like [Iris pallida]|uniref:ATP synthase subunit d, mitochondrial-like n=1 Tax=Iris pallida TaxID=29817 RepID=A0AAX6DPX2_IRIPA|nr:ATP synthase subunit d, mitochondrial-like [Iris pallida]KAJ6795671.1 ATP synthase subunit d, mitochondrial-like [Iris pallida]KAJ6843156.1 ATP synthase subunit d, mitochondrial-like [Iris pallida]